MTKRANKERREHPRLNQELPVKIAANGYDFVTATQNISCLGAYCRVSKYIPPFTKIAIKLALPLANGNAKKYCDVNCTGVIVRTDDETEGGFNIAIFFNDIKDAQKQKITQYISRFLPVASSNN